MNTYIIISVLSISVIFSYGFERISEYFKVPSVALLIFTGILIREYMTYNDYRIQPIVNLLPILGNIGLILIVLEGALDLELTKEKLGTIYKSFFASGIMLVASSIAIAFFFHYFFEIPKDIMLINAIPLGVISSAVAISSVRNLKSQKREFIIYESTFSDILGIMLFNFVATNIVINASAIFHFFGESLLTVLGSIVGTVFIAFLLNKINHHVKFFLIIAILMLVYALGKTYHLSTLMLIFFFGLFMKNNQAFIPPFLRKYFNSSDLDRELGFLNILTAECAFLVRTFFFIAFGMSIDIRQFNNPNIFIAALAILLIIYSIRFIILLLISPRNLFPEVLIAPRGLITILLYLSIPTIMISDKFGNDLYLSVILCSLLVMTIGNLLTSKEKIVLDLDNPNSKLTQDKITYFDIDQKL